MIIVEELHELVEGEERIQDFFVGSPDFYQGGGVGSDKSVAVQTGKIMP